MELHKKTDRPSSISMYIHIRHRECNYKRSTQYQSPGAANYSIYWSAYIISHREYSL